MEFLVLTVEGVAMKMSVFSVLSVQACQSSMGLLCTCVCVCGHFPYFLRHYLHNRRNSILLTFYSDSFPPTHTLQPAASQSEARVPPQLCQKSFHIKVKEVLETI